jgi:hypothetical protein
MFKKIQGYDDYYIFNDGTVHSFKGSAPHIMKPYKGNKGYYYISLNKGCKCTKYYVHRLVALYYIPNPDKKEQVNHINGVKDDNNISNLEWTTRSENMIHAYKSLGIRHSRAVFTDDQVRRIRALRKSGVSCIKLGKMFNTSRVHIYCIATKRSYRYLN